MNDNASWMQDPTRAFLLRRAISIAVTLIFLGISVTLDYLLPPRVKIAVLALDGFYRARLALRWLSQHELSQLTRGSVVVAVLFSIVVLFCTAPTASLLVSYRWLLDHLIGTVVVTLRYSQDDGEPGPNSVNYVIQRDCALTYTLAALAIPFRRSLVSWVYWTSTRLVLGPILFVVSYGIMRPFLPRPNVIGTTLNRARVMLARTIELSMEYFSLTRAYVLDYLPRAIHKRLSQREQKQHVISGIPFYKYEPLKRGQMRLLLLHRQKWILAGTIHASIVQTPLGLAGDYEAISYCWGSSKRVEEILVDGCRFAVTSSAHDVLFARRSIWCDRAVWIDAICINQQDEVEKSEQVQQMRHIYRNATRVIMMPVTDWHACLAAPLLYEIAAGPHMWADTLVSLNSIAMGDKFSLTLEALLQLLTNEYHNRAWVCQELAVGRKVELYYGRRYFPFKMYCEIVRHLTDQQSQHLLLRGVNIKVPQSHDGSAMRHVLAMYSFREDCSLTTDHGEQTKLENVLLLASDFHASDPRDKVFALLGISNYEANDLVKADYTKTIPQVFEDAAAWLLCHQERPAIKLLALAGIGQTETRLVVPSWVPDLSEERPRAGFLFTDPIFDSNSFNAGGNLRARVVRANLLHSLLVDGISCDSIKYLSSAGIYDVGGVLYRVELEGQEVARRKVAFISSTIELLDSLSHLWPADSSLGRDNLWTALVADRIDRKRPADHKFRDVFSQWLKCLDALARTEDRDHDRIIAQFFTKSFRSTLNVASMHAYSSSVASACYGRRFAVTQRGRLCLVPPLTRIGDKVFVPCGAQAPCLIRECSGCGQDRGCFQLVGEAYVQGIMMGEGLDGSGVSTVTLA